ncbi:MAG: flagellar assembly protein FliH [Ignavibacterium sp.]|nr:flagellar assembly protein FliH [Ignavibacterium sp.]MDW8374122.1 FliH/SctL family protein [Ignavibacteriales bacterium]
MSEKIILNTPSNKIKAVKLTEVIETFNQEDENQRRQKEIEIEFHNQFIKGFKEGQKEAINRLQKDYNEKLKEVFSILDSIQSKIDNQIKEQYHRLEEFVINLSFQIAEKIIRREIQKESPVVKVIEESLKKLTSANEITVKLNPLDMNLIETNSASIARNINSSKIRFEADESVERGGCFIETEIGNADGRIKSQIENLLKQLETCFEENND